MKFSIDINDFDTMIQPTDWRYAAAITGLVKFFKFHNIKYDTLNSCIDKPEEYIHGFDGILYNQSDITEERYLDYVEHYFRKDMTHITILKMLESDTFDDEIIKEVNGLLKSVKEALNKIFKKVKLDKKGSKKDLVIKFLKHYINFAEDCFCEDMKYLDILEMLESNNFDKEKINDFLRTLFDSVLRKIEFDGNNKDYIIKFLTENRYHIIKGLGMVEGSFYGNYCKETLFMTDDNPHCRLCGYSVNEGKKTMVLGFCFSKESTESHDIPEFDFVPFAFSNSDMFETYFINNNFSIDTLIQTSDWISAELAKIDKNDSRDKLLAVLKKADSFIKFDVEIITKVRDDEMYKSFFVRSERLECLRKLSEQSLHFAYKISNDYWLNLEREVYERCLNNVLLDDLILQLLKLYFDNDVNKTTVKIRTDSLIDINQSWKGNGIMEEIQLAKKLGFIVSQELVKISGKNKVFSYKQKIISALVAHDYDRAKEVILSLSAYVKMEFPFFYKFLEDAEENKDIAFAFASALHVDDKKNNYKKETE